MANVCIIFCYSFDIWLCFYLIFPFCLPPYWRLHCLRSEEWKINTTKGSLNHILREDLESRHRGWTKVKTLKWTWLYPPTHRRRIHICLPSWYSVFFFVAGEEYSILVAGVFFGGGGWGGIDEQDMKLIRGQLRFALLLEVRRYGFEYFDVLQRSLNLAFFTLNSA